MNNKVDASKIPYLVKLNNDSVIYDGDWEVIATGNTATGTYTYFESYVGTIYCRISAKYAVWKTSGPLLQGAVPKDFQFVLKGQNDVLNTTLYYPETLPYVAPMENSGTTTLTFNGQIPYNVPGSPTQYIYPSIGYSCDLSEYDILAYSPTDQYNPYVIYADKQRTKWYCMVVGANTTPSDQAVLATSRDSYPTISDEACINKNKGQYYSAMQVLPNVNYIGQNQFLVFP